MNLCLQNSGYTVYIKETRSELTASYKTIFSIIVIYN